MGITCIVFMVKGTEPVTVEDVVNHFDHVRDLVGIEHVGIGSDAGVESNDLGAPQILKEMLAKTDPRYHIHGSHEVVAGLEGQKRVHDLTAAFVRRGYTDEHLRLVLGQNCAECWEKSGMPDTPTASSRLRRCCRRLFRLGRILHAFFEPVTSSVTV